jgi:hypothetical protein
VIALNPNAARDARALDAERKARGPRGPLHGVPVLLKDNFETVDMPDHRGSLALRGIVPPRDAFQVMKLRRAGAVLLGKLNLHELALGLTTHSSLGGQTLDPYDLARAPEDRVGDPAWLRRRALRLHDGDRYERLDSYSQLAQLDRRSPAVLWVVEPCLASSRSATPRTPADRWHERSRTSR